MRCKKCGAQGKHEYSLNSRTRHRRTFGRFLQLGDLETSEEGNNLVEWSGYYYEGGVLVRYVIELYNNGDTLSYGAALFYDC